MQRQLDLPGTPPPKTDHPDPFANHRQQMSPDQSVMRLCILLFRCHMCGEDHEMQHYITLAVQSDEGFAQTLATELEREDNAVRLLGSSAHTWHTAQGDVEERQRTLEASAEQARGAILGIAITTEQEYTCDDCGSTFETMGKLRQHRRRNPLTNVREGPPQCLAQAVPEAVQKQEEDKTS